MNTQEGFIEVRKTARFFTLGKLSKNTKEVWIVLHGYGYHAGYFIERFVPIAGEDMFIIAPEGLSRYYKDGFSGKVGASWMTKEAREEEISDYVNYLNVLAKDIFTKVDRADVKLNILGFSQGSSTMVRWLNDRTVKADHLIVWCGKVPDDFDYENDRDLFDSSKNFLLLGEKDPFLQWALPANYLERYEKNSLNFQTIWFDGEHEIREEELLALRKMING